jgi:hypothetical protein
MIISDDSIGAPKLAHEMMRLAEARASRNIGDYWSGGSGPDDFRDQPAARARIR